MKHLRRWGLSPPARYREKRGATGLPCAPTDVLVV